ncbi:MAG: phenylalanine--tRNA ligase subunit beta [Phycisphaerae bacterium]|nr:phenylalanine--tRNA ligase subunit beta [Phycisphaerae bacterium]MDW8262440.1 phenylalanine--tRNA ligase subunit beta [Phycisphaerales bacterium]
MKISLNWLSDYLPGPADPAEFAEVLTFGGLPVEGIEALGDDTVLEVEVTSNRGDCLSHLGVARELSALLPRELRPPSPAFPESSTRADAVTSVTIEDTARCPYYGARIIRGVTVGPSPGWMTRRLEAVGLRSINNVVDCTNYVMFELGQPLHAFDFDKLAGGRIVVRAARPGESLVTLDGHRRPLDGEMLCICDESRPVALAGIMGGLDSEVGALTRNVLLESARFEALTVRRTGRRLGIRSDAAYRFERGIDPSLAPLAAARCAQLIAETAGGEILAGLAETGSAAAAPLVLVLRLATLRKVLGIEIEPSRAVEALGRLGLHPRLAGDEITCSIPSCRLDLSMEIDLVEEVARVIGYQHIPVRQRIEIKLAPPEPDHASEEKIRQSLIGAGFFEAITFSFATDGLGELFAPAGVRLCQADPMTRKTDSKLRPSLLPGLLEAIRRNESNGIEQARFFEIGSTFWHKNDGSIDERRRLGIAGAVDFRTLRGAVEAVLSALDARKRMEVVPAEVAGYSAGAAGSIRWNGQPIGTIGMVDRRIAARLDLRQTVAAAELELAALIAGTQHVPQLVPLPKFPAVRRDLSLIVPEHLPYSAIHNLIETQQLESLEDVEFVTTYRGKPLQAGQKSVTISLIFRSPTATLTSESVDNAVNRLVAAAKASLGAELRV